MHLSRILLLALFFVGCGQTHSEKAAQNGFETKSALHSVSSAGSESVIVYGPPAAVKKKGTDETKTNARTPQKNSVVNSYNDEFSLKNSKINAQNPVVKQEPDAVDEQSIIDSLSANSPELVKPEPAKTTAKLTKIAHTGTKSPSLSAAEKNKECARATLFETPAPGYCSCDLDEFDQRECTFKESF